MDRPCRAKPGVVLPIQRKGRTAKGFCPTRLSISRGDANNDGSININDPTYLVDYIFHGGPEPFPSLLLGDCGCDGIVNIGDAVWLVQYLFFGGPPPVNPCFEF